jgi:hypothetical protein
VVEETLLIAALIVDHCATQVEKYQIADVFIEIALIGIEGKQTNYKLQFI